MVKVWRREAKSEGYTHIVNVEVTGAGAVHIAAWSVGPKGGTHHGWASFSAAEWVTVAERVARRLCWKHDTVAERLYPGGDDLNGYGCRACTEELVTLGCKMFISEPEPKEEVRA